MTTTTTGFDPTRDPFVEPDRFLTREATLFFEDQQTQIDASPTVEGLAVNGTANASVALTALVANAAAGFYRIGAYQQVITPGGVSGQTTLSITWTFNGQVLTRTFAVMNGNLVTTYQSDDLPLIQVDGGTPISFAIVYASNPASAMVFAYGLTAELVKLKAA